MSSGSGYSSLLRRAPVAAFGLLLIAPNANAWKVTTHMVVAERLRRNGSTGALVRPAPARQKGASRLRRKRRQLRTPSLRHALPLIRQPAPSATREPSRPTAPPQ